jgi:alkylation response protein AidB-like acyl-CoA dehydrogenase
MSAKSPVDFNEFLMKFSEHLKHIFHVRSNVDQLAINRGMPPFVMRDIMQMNPLSVGIPEAYGGRGCKMEENIGLLAAASYESLSLSLTLGINSALFLQPLAKYGQEEIKQPIFDRFLHNQNMGGLMITEPGHGSDALNMQTSFQLQEDAYRIKGIKHWAGLTGWADYWILAAREMDSSGNLKRDIDFFVCDVNSANQHIEVEEYFENLGLYQIPYGRNKIDVSIPQKQKLVPETTGVKMLLDMLHRSRLQFPGMAMGFIHRLLDESIAHSMKRSVGGKPLISYDQVQNRLAKMQAAFTITSAMCYFSSKTAGIENDLSMKSFEANSIKSVVSDLMQEVAQSATQLVGAQAYKLNHMAGRGIVDSRPFQIFEGSNDILYSQISENIVKLMKKAKQSNLYQFLKEFDLSSKASDYLKNILDFNIDTNVAQSKMVELGKILGRIMSSELVINLGEKGFNKELISNGINILNQEITTLMSGFKSEIQPILLENYQENGSWLKI